jgi:hypothetical protein
VSQAARRVHARRVAVFCGRCDLSKGVGVPRHLFICRGGFPQLGCGASRSRRLSRASRALPVGLARSLRGVRRWPYLADSVPDRTRPGDAAPQLGPSSRRHPRLPQPKSCRGSYAAKTSQGNKLPPRMRPKCDHDAQERLGIAGKRAERLSTLQPSIWLHKRKRPALAGTPPHAPDENRTRDLRLERPTLFGPREGTVDH